ncbi:MAG: thiamine phosphate synthase [Dehalococcoidales bacterium]|jgi:thiamine-phosphate pyrophosphorylase|nr:thiamine phosphate synthase [Dehalococcoidales bacterium]MDD3264314.1 thiamine phosphate synthase [Dehalococcoidales bacterium]MDD4322065.1 thiamine phosphate synthase [Dehalococcoidales bacterium]MDD4793636.1 thiamine phosphate synthase [Dehalococcoidales bacterium]MDD5497881.1 thiamine phosphate synthase [Dehalococcoidales bacterium]
MDEFKQSELPGGTLRMLDASLNRAAEGLRVLEDVSRMVLNDTSLTHALKKMRHDLDKSPVLAREKLLFWRDSQNDIGQSVSVENTLCHKDITSLVAANAQRAQQALRTIEELARLGNSGIQSKTIECMRFNLYTLEKEITSRLVRADKRKLIKGLYVILDSSLLGGRSHLEMASMVLEAGVKIIQLREKNMPSGKMLDLACSLNEMCISHQAILIINDYLDIALASNASGIHLGQKDIPLPVARKHLPFGTLIGISVDSPEQAVKAEQDGADYVAPQAVFETSSKNCRAIGLEALIAIRQAVTIPVVAIGGINIDNIDRVIKAGVDAAAVISSVTFSPQPVKTAREMNRRFYMAD